MKKALLIGLFALISVIGTGCGVSGQQLPTNGNVENTPVADATQAEPVVMNSTPTSSGTNESPSYLNATYEFDGTPVALVDGVAETEATPGSASKIVTRFFGNEAFGELNGDNNEDVAFLITQDYEGSGTFYYIVSALQTDAGYKGTNAILLGDRIAPQTTKIVDGQIVVCYADRDPSEPFTVEPSIGISKYFILVDNNLVETFNLYQITNREWKWESTLINDGTTISPKEADIFTITFKDDGSLTGTTDCNSFSGQYKAKEENKLSFELSVSTTKNCAGSQENEFLKHLGEINGFLIKYPENKLVLLMNYDSGSMIFK